MSCSYIFIYIYFLEKFLYWCAGIFLLLFMVFILSSNKFT